MDETEKLERYVKQIVLRKPLKPIEKMRDNELKARSATLDKILADLIKWQKDMPRQSKSPYNKKLADWIAATEKRIKDVEDEIKKRKGK